MTPVTSFPTVPPPRKGETIEVLVWGKWYPATIKSSNAKARDFVAVLEHGIVVEIPFDAFDRWRRVQP